MKRFIFAKLQEWKARISQDDDNTGDVDAQILDNLTKEEAAYQHHFAQAYTNWQNLSQDKRKEQWRFECQRAFAEEYDRHQDTRERLDQLEQEIHHLRDQLNQHQNGHPSSSSGLNITSVPVSRFTMTSFTSQKARDLQHWDYDRLLDKWKNRIRQDRSVQHPLPSAAPLPANNGPTNGASSSYGHNGALDDPEQRYQDDGDYENEDEDLVDAPGEEEDEDMVPTVQPHERMASDVLDPNLRDGGGNMDDGGRMLMGLKGFPQGTNGNGA